MFCIISYNPFFPGPISDVRRQHSVNRPLLSINNSLTVSLSLALLHAHVPSVYCLLDNLSTRKLVQSRHSLTIYQRNIKKFLLILTNLPSIGLLHFTDLLFLDLGGESFFTSSSLGVHTSEVDNIGLLADPSSTSVDAAVLVLTTCSGRLLLTSRAFLVFGHLEISSS